MYLRPQRGGGGVRGRNICFFVDMYLKELSRMQKKHQKILFLAEVIKFLNLSQYNYYTRANFKSRYLKMTLGTFFEKTMHGRGPKLGSYVSLTSFNKLKSGIFVKKKKCRFLWSKIIAHFANFGHFCP